MNWKEKMARLAEAGFTQMQIAEKCGVRQSSISAIARGVTKCPSFDLGTRLQKLVDELPPADVSRAPAVAESGSSMAAGQG